MRKNMVLIILVIIISILLLIFGATNTVIGIFSRDIHINDVNVGSKHLVTTFLGAIFLISGLMFMCEKSNMKKKEGLK